MNCLYCDRPLALLKRLTGDGEFCSKEHRKLYQHEHNQLAIARLLESQHVVSAPQVKPRQGSPAAAPAPPPVKKVEERKPQPAGFLWEYPREAKADSGLAQLTGEPRGFEFVTAWAETGAPSTQPNAALFQSEPIAPRSFGTAMRFPNWSSPRPPVRLSEILSTSTAEIAAGGEPRGAGFVSERPPAPLAWGPGRPSPDRAAGFAPKPKFKIEPQTAPIDIGVFPVRGDSKLRQAAFLPEHAAPRSAPHQIQQLPADARWKALQPALPERIPARVVPVLGALFARPVRPTVLEQFPTIFEIPLRPVSFPPVALRMASLAERLHRTDRIGFTPP
jgi:hypothetical protein